MASSDQEENWQKIAVKLAPHKLRSSFRILLYSGLFSVGNAFSKEIAEVNLPEIIVNAPYSDINATFDDSYKTANSTHQSQKDLAVAHERSIDEVLRGYQSIGVTKGGGTGIGLLKVRGVSGQGLVMLDGMPVPDTLPGVINLNALLPEGLDSLDIRRGFSPASRPFSSLGGSIDLTSRTARNNSLDLRVEGGTFGFLKETLRGNLAADKARLAVTVNRSDTFDGAYHAQKSNNNPERDPFHGNQVLIKANVEISESVDWAGSMLYRDSWNGWDSYGIRNGMLAMADEKGAFLSEENWMAQNTVRAIVNENWTTRLQVGFTHTDNHAQVLGITPGYTTDLYLARWENDQTVWHGQGDEGLHLVWGAEGRHELINAPTYGPPPFLEPGMPFAESRNQQAGFLETRFDYKKFSGDIGARYESYDRFQNQMLYHASVAWQALDKIRLHANAGNGFRIPSYAERFFPILGNPNLQPERGAGGDIGLEWQALSNLKINLSGFYTRYDNLMVVSWVPQPSVQLPCIGECISNVANATIAGMEVGGAFEFSQQVRGGVDYTYNDSRNLDNGLRLPFQATNTVRAWSEWQSSQLPVTLWIEGIYRGLSQNDLGNTLDVDDAFRLNVFTNYQVTPSFNLYVRGENITNDKTPDAFSFDYPGAAVYGGVLWKL